MPLKHLVRFLLPYFALSILLSVAMYLVLDRQAIHLADEMVTYWRELAQKDIQSGNVYQSIAKNYRVVNFSKSIEAIKVLDSNTGEEQLSIGNSNIKPISSSSETVGYGLFKYQKSLTLNSHLKAYFFINSRFYNWIFIVGIFVLILPLLLLGFMHFKYSSNLAIKKQRFILDSLMMLFERKRSKYPLALDKDLASTWEYIGSKFDELLEIEKSYSNLEEKFKLSKKVAHDIRTPLQALNMATDCLESNPAAAKKLIRSSSERINRVAEDLLQNTSGQIDRDLPSVPLKINLENLVDELSLKAQKSNITIQSSISGCDVELSPRELTQFTRHISNLISNSIEATSPGKTIQFISKIEENGVTGKVSDQGSGMNSLVLKKALSGSFTTKASGNGIGLSSAKEFFEKYKGTFQITSAPHEGTEISFELPF